MNFYVMRAEYQDGTWSNPWTAWADNIEGAAAKATELVHHLEARQFQFRLRPTYEAETFYGHEPGDAIVEHSDVKWDVDYDTSPIRI